MDVYKGYESFYVALTNHAQNQEFPQGWNDWRTDAAQIADHYPEDAPLTKRDSASYSNLRKEVNNDQWGDDWVTLMRQGKAAKALRVADDSDEQVRTSVPAGGGPSTSAPSVHREAGALSTVSSGREAGTLPANSGREAGVLPASSGREAGMPSISSGCEVGIVVSGRVAGTSTGRPSSRVPPAGREAGVMSLLEDPDPVRATVEESVVTLSLRSTCL